MAAFGKQTTIINQKWHFFFLFCFEKSTCFTGSNNITSLMNYFPGRVSPRFSCAPRKLCVFSYTLIIFLCCMFSSLGCELF